MKSATTPSTPLRARARPEVLAPAGDPLALRAALAAGADAVYLGMARFNARGRAERFRGVTLESCVRTAHEHGARVHVTLNTLVHDDELPRAVELAEEALAARADAAIVQDIGLARILRERVPELPLHGSTQMTIHAPEQAAEAVRLLGLRRVIVARECSVEEVRAIADAVAPFGADVEVFVHGALCFAYSGQCLMSNFAGRRSANRGLCAQNCRFDFTASEPSRERFVELPVFSARRAHQLISMKDLAAFEAVAPLANAGVASFKIEGRLKGPDYVGETVRLYREAIDAWERERPFDGESAERSARRVYSRCFTNGYLRGAIDASMRGDKREMEGEPDAIVVSADRTRGIVVLSPRPGHSITKGQGYAYSHDRYRGGFRVLSIDRDGSNASNESNASKASNTSKRVRARVRFGAEASGRRHRRGARGRTRPPPPLPHGLGVWLNDDPDVESRTSALLARVDLVSAEKEAIGVRFLASGRVGDPLVVRATSEDGDDVEAASERPIEPAKTRPVDEPMLAEHLGRLGGTRYRLEAIEAGELACGGFLPVAELHAVRRVVVERLEHSRRKRRSERPSGEIPPVADSGVREAARTTALVVSVSTPDAARAALAAGAERVVIDDGELVVRDPRERAPAWSDIATELDRKIAIRLPPIAHAPRADAERIATLRALFPRAGYTAAHLGQLALFREAGLDAAADLYLNAYGLQSILALRHAGARTVTLSLEVEAREAARVARSAPEDVEVEVVAGGRVFSMLTRQDWDLARNERFVAASEHGHPYVFEAMGDARSGTILWEARELVGARALPVLARAVDAVRLDLGHHDARAVETIVRAYRLALDRSLEGDGEDASAAAIAEHSRFAPYGRFEGHLFRGARTFDDGE